MTSGARPRHATTFASSADDLRTSPHSAPIVDQRWPAPTRRAWSPFVRVSVGAAALSPTQAWAHVKWFAPYIVGAAPAPVAQTMRDGWFWLGIGLVIGFFVAARTIERGRGSGP